MSVASVSDEPIGESYGPSIDPTTYVKCFGVFIHAKQLEKHEGPNLSYRVTRRLLKCI